MGKEVNTAARLSSCAKPGQILLSGATYDAIGNAGPIQCRPHGRMTLRGTAQPLVTFSALLDRAQHDDLIRTRLEPLLADQGANP